jgi:hypothetical protein
MSVSSRPLKLYLKLRTSVGAEMSLVQTMFKGQHIYIHEAQNKRLYNYIL